MKIILLVVQARLSIRNVISTILLYTVVSRIYYIIYIHICRSISLLRLMSEKLVGVLVEIYGVRKFRSGARLYASGFSVYMRVREERGESRIHER